MSRIYRTMDRRDLEALLTVPNVDDAAKDAIRAELAARKTEDARRLDPNAARRVLADRRKAPQAHAAAPRTTTPLVLRLPLPPSTNAAWRAVNGHVLLSRAARKWKREAAAAIAAQRGARFIAGKVALDMDVTLRRKRADLSNALKLTEDALKNVVMEDDSEVYEITLRKHVGPNAGVVVTVRPFEDERQAAA